MKVQSAVLRFADDPRRNQEAKGHGHNQIYVARRGPCRSGVNLVDWQAEFLGDSLDRNCISVRCGLGTVDAERTLADVLQASSCAFVWAADYIDRLYPVLIVKGTQ